MNARRITILARMAEFARMQLEVISVFARKVSEVSLLVGNLLLLWIWIDDDAGTLTNITCLAVT